MNHDCREELHNADLRVTPARLGVLEALEHSDMPLDVAAIMRYLKAHNVPVNEVTVFRILAAFTNKGIAKPIQLNEGKQRFEYADKPSHHHFVCTACGAIADVAGCNVDILEKQIEKTNGAIVTRHSLEFFGLCRRCAI